MENSGKVIKNFVWRFAERCGVQAVTFVISVVLARLLAPEDYGIIALVTAFTSILQVFVDSGLGTALVQKKDADDLDFSSVFYFNVVVCFILYTVLFFVAPVLADFYEDASLVAVIRVLSLTVLISGIKGIQQAYVFRNMMFKKFFFSTVGGTVLSAAIGLYMAYAGYGVWALVCQQVSNTAVDTLILWFTVKWYPKKMFSLGRLKRLLSFGWKILISSLLDTIYNNVQNLIIGKVYSKKKLAYYNQGEKFPKVIVTNVNTAMDSVLLPTLSNMQDDIIDVKKMTKNAIRMSTYILAPLMSGLLFCSNTIVKLVLTEKWIECVPYLRIFCAIYIFWPIHTTNLNAINAMGRSDWLLRLEIMKKIIGIFILLLTVRISVLAMAYGLLISSMISLFINSWPNKQLIDYGIGEQMKDILPSLVNSFIMGGCVYFIGYLNFSLGYILLIQILSGMIIYIGISYILNIREFEFIMEKIKQLK